MRLGFIAWVPASPVLCEKGRQASIAIHSLWGSVLAALALSSSPSEAALVSKSQSSATAANLNTPRSDVVDASVMPNRVTIGSTAIVSDLAALVSLFDGAVTLLGSCFVRRLLLAGFPIHSHKKVLCPSM